MNRREYLVSASTLSVTAVAGCSGSDGSEEGGGGTDPDDGPEQNMSGDDPETEQENETDSDPEENQDTDEFIEGTPSEILPSEDFDPFGWVYTGDNTDRYTISNDGQYRERSYVYENHTLSFEVWVFDSVDAAKTGFEKRLGNMPSERELIPEDIGDEGYRYKSGAYFIFFRQANVIARIRTDRGFSVARENAERMRDDW